MEQQELKQLIEQVNTTVAEVYQKRNGQPSFWFTHAPITGTYVLQLTFQHRISPEIVGETILEVNDQKMGLADFCVLLNALSAEWNFRLLAHAFDKPTLAYLRQHVNAHIREDIVI
ncbi:hypothetical protein [Limosilactobacillus caecicola]|uniref:hypothetical protein n=1 Tax=Limosilactobacillus caecicola TaxID=2941332 RepID=UPI00203C1CE8|nr:hypothetical protein [Limosilactobacillus caecicola]